MFGEVHIKFRGADKVLKFNINARYMFCQMHEITEEQFSDFFRNELNVTKFRDLIFCAMLSADSQAERVKDYNIYDIGEWMDEAGEKEVVRVLNVASESNTTEQATEEPSKKKKPR